MTYSDIAKSITNKIWLSRDQAESLAAGIDEALGKQADYIKALELQIKHPGGSFCAYCQHHFESNTSEEDMLKIVEHALDCDKSPLHAVSTAAMFYEDVLKRVVSEHSNGHTMGFDCKTCLILSEFINSQRTCDASNDGEVKS